MNEEMELIPVILSDHPDVSAVPEEIRILPLGEVESQKGNFIVDDKSCECIIRAFKERALDLVIDYEHQTLKDIEAPAGGWITEIYKTKDALAAKVKWTPRAQEYLKNREYRYLSPVVLVSKKDRRAVSIHSVALTNTPAIDGMFAIVNSLDIEHFTKQKKEEDSKMELKELAKRLGLPEDATESDVEAALSAAAKALGDSKGDDAAKPETDTAAEGQAAEAVANKSAMVANGRILSLLGLKDDAKTEDVLAKIQSLSGEKSHIEEILQLKEELAQRDADELVMTALKEGKITAAQKEWAAEYALSDKKGFKAFLEKAPAVVPQGKLELKEDPAPSVSDVDMEILKNCGITKEDAEKFVLKREEA